MGVGTVPALCVKGHVSWLLIELFYCNRALFGHNRKSTFRSRLLGHIKHVSRQDLSRIAFPQVGISKLAALHQCMF